jgi:signal transduction histidine kinase/AraC-like DNA-binding protein/ABC-type sugar transport system substrate-binding protein
LVSHRLRIGSRIGSADPFWVQVREAVYQKAQQLAIDLVPIDIGHAARFSKEEHAELVDELLAQDLDALISTYLPGDLAYRILDFGLPVIHLTETDVRHPLFAAPLGFFDIAHTVGAYLAERLQGHGHVLVIGGLLADHGEDGRSRLAGVYDSLAAFPDIRITHIPSAWRYERALDSISAAMRQLDTPIDAIFGLSDSLALAGRDTGRALGLLPERALIVGINGDPSALAAIADGSMAATIETSAADFAAQALDLAGRAARGQPLPDHFGYQPRLVTSANVDAVAMQKLTEIANLPNRLVGVNHQQDQRQLTQLRASLEISRRIGSILDRQQLLSEIADIIRTSYGYDRVQVFQWHEQEHILTLDQAGYDLASRACIRDDDPGVLAEALRRNAPIFIADTRHSHRFPPDPSWPDTLSRVILPIRLGDRLRGMLDLHSHTATQRTRQELVGLQSLADQLGLAMHNAELYSAAIQARAVAEKADQLKTRLLATVSHELRAPLNLIIGYSEAGLSAANSNSAAIPATLLHDLYRIYQSGTHLTRLIADLLDLSRAEIGELDLVPEPIAPRPFLEEVFRSIAESGAARDGVEWRLNLPSRLPMLEADPVRLRQILLNLLSNARTFTTSGQITLGAEVLLPHLHIWVADTGCGIPIAMQERIFEPFVTDTRGGDQAEGIGLGLCITRQLVQLHRGSISLESQPGQGSAFHMYLPLPSLRGQLATPPPSAQPVLLLISAHDQPPTSIRDLSERQQLAIWHLRTGDDLNGLMALIRPAALAWDMTDASPNDWTLIQKLRSHAQWCQLPFILYNQDHDTAEASSGLTNFLLKPWSGSTLSDAINALRPAEHSGAILVVDDDPQARDMYQRLVAAELPDYTVHTADGGAAALAFLAHTAPSLVILDLLMPDVDGFAVLAQMRADRRTRQIPVLVISGQILSLKDVERLDHALVTFHSKGVLSEPETSARVQQALAEHGTPSQNTSTLVRRAVAYMQQHFAHDLSRQQIANAIGISQNYLSRIFQHELGISPWEYLSRYRIKQAQDLLRDTEHSITDVAAQVGFDDPAYFSRVFRKQIGHSPQRYREQLL